MSGEPQLSPPLELGPRQLLNQPDCSSPYWLAFWWNHFRFDGATVLCEIVSSSWEMPLWLMSDGSEGCWQRDAQHPCSYQMNKSGPTNDDIIYWCCANLSTFDAVSTRWSKYLRLLLLQYQLLYPINLCASLTYFIPNWCRAVYLIY